MIGHTDRLQSFHENLVNKDMIAMIHQDLFKERFEMMSPPLMKSLLTTKINHFRTFFPQKS